LGKSFNSGGFYDPSLPFGPILFKYGHQPLLGTVMTMGWSY